eukprot:scaffold3920_cov262-Pinguiococcus_pyrenoidosus.AAC.10
MRRRCKGLTTRRTRLVDGRARGFMNGVISGLPHMLSLPGTGCLLAALPCAESPGERIGWKTTPSC